jgi:hypothetical protein
MTSVKVNGSFGLAGSMKKWDKAESNSARLVAVNTVNHFKKGFTQGGGQTDASLSGWEPRQFTKGKGRRNTLVQTGTLQKDIRRKVVTSSRIIVGTSSITKGYADAHNEGATIVITQKMINYFWAKHYEARGKAEKDYWKNLALHKGSTITIPKREFIGDSRKLTTSNEKILHSQIDKVFGI